MTEDKERDEALIAEIAEVFPPDTVDVQSRYVIVHQLRASADIQDAQTKRETRWADTSDRACLMRKAADALDALLAKLQPAPKPDRAEVLASIVLDLARTDFNSDDLDEREPEAVAIIRRHFDELRAEWEAEQEVVPRDVAESWKARADNLKEDRENLLSNLAIMMSKHVENWPEPRRFSTAIALLDKTLTEALTKREAERPAVVVPREVKLWADSVGYCSATRYEERTTAKWIKSLDGAKGDE